MSLVNLIIGFDRLWSGSKDTSAIFFQKNRSGQCVTSYTSKLLLILPFRQVFFIRIDPHYSSFLLIPTYNLVHKSYFSVIFHSVFILYYTFHGVFCERPFELLASVAATVVVFLYCVVEYSIRGKNSHGSNWDLKLVSFLNFLCY